MALSAADIESQLTLVQTNIAAALTNPAPNWRVGEVSFNQQDYLKYLFDQQRALIEQLRAFPSEEITTVQNEVDALGKDGTQYMGEDDV